MPNRLLLSLLLTVSFFSLSSQNGDIIKEETIHFKRDKPWKKVSPKKADFTKTTTEYESGMRVIEKLRLSDNQIVHKESYLNNKPTGNWLSYSESQGLIEYKADSLPLCEEQEKSNKPQNEVDSILAQRSLPIYKETTTDFFEAIVTKVRYPSYAKDMGISGTVFLGFKVDSIGYVKDVCIKRSAHWSLDLEAFRVINLLDKFKIPAKEKGQPIETQMTVPVKFNLR